MKICSTLAASLGVLCALCGSLWAAERAPNIVIILTDDQGYADIRFNPHHPNEVSTPHMDSLARKSVFFTQA